jgi:hypothetical protein
MAAAPWMNLRRVNLVIVYLPSSRA